jgi:thioredoxin reductase
MRNNDRQAVPDKDRVYDCIIVGAGPGGLQAAIYLGRFNRDVLLIDRGGGRTAHARAIENFLTQKAISGKELPCKVRHRLLGCERQFPPHREPL